MLTKKINRYDYGIIFLISLVAFGGIGGAMQPIRILGIMFLPMVVTSLVTNKMSKEEKWVFRFFLFFILYAVISLLWSFNQSEGVKELGYFVCHFSLFFMLVFWSKKANNPFKAILNGWLMVLLLTLPIAFIEVITNWHLPISKYEADKLMNLGGNIIKQRYASVTFSNYNTYVVLLVFCLPFLLTHLKIIRKLRIQLFYWIVFLSVSVILFINASRGGILCWGILLIFYFVYDRKKKQWSMGSIFLGILVLLMAVYVFNEYSTEVLQQFSYRINEGDKSFFEDSSRFYLYQVALILWINSVFMGTGIGSEAAAMSSISSGIVATHNMYLEVLLQFGIIIFILFIVFLYKIFSKISIINFKPIKFIMISFLLIFIPIFIVNSGYLLMPSLWVLLGSLFIISNIDTDTRKR